MRISGCNQPAHETALPPPRRGGLLAGFNFTAQAKIERVVEKTFTVSAAGTLQVDTQGGEIRVSPSSESVVKVTARQKIRASSEAEADDLLKKLELTIEQSGSDVRASAKYERKGAGFHFGFWPPVQVDFIVSVPAGFAADLRTSGGGITVGDLAGKVNARSSGGGIKLGRLGAGVDARTSGGSITLDASTSGGGVDAEGLTITMEKGGRDRSRLAGRVNGGGPVLKLRSSGGGISVRTR